MKLQSYWVYLLTTIVFWGATPAVAKIALAELSNFQLLFWTSWTGLATLLLLVISQKKLPALKKLTLFDFAVMAGMGTLGIYLYYILLFLSFDLAPAGQANVVNYLWPVFIILFSVPILKEPFKTKTLIAIAMSFFGALVVMTQGKLVNFETQYITGYFYAALAAVCYGLFSVLGKKLSYEKFMSMMLYYLFATLLITGTVFIRGDFVVPTSLSTLISILLLGVLFNSVAFVFWFKALSIGDTHKTANFAYVVPFVALLFTWVFNAEMLTWYAFVGLGLIVGGIAIQNRP